MLNVKLRDTVEKVLRDHPETRNRDSRLWLLVCWYLHPEYFRTDDGKTWLDWNGVEAILPLESTTARIRAVFQNKHKQYLPTDPKVQAYRAKTKKDQAGLQVWEQQNP